VQLLCSAANRSSPEHATPLYHSVDIIVLQAVCATSLVSGTRRLCDHSAMCYTDSVPPLPTSLFMLWWCQQSRLRSTDGRTIGEWCIARNMEVVMTWLTYYPKIWLKVLRKISKFRGNSPLSLPISKMGIYPTFAKLWHIMSFWTKKFSSHFSHMWQCKVQLTHFTPIHNSNTTLPPCLFNTQCHSKTDDSHCHHHSRSRPSLFLTLSDPTSNLVRQYDFPVPLWCRKTSDMVFVAFVRPLSEPVWRFSSWCRINKFPSLLSFLSDFGIKFTHFYNFKQHVMSITCSCYKHSLQWTSTLYVSYILATKSIHIHFTKRPTHASISTLLYSH
jgi:hypothetical protein